MMAITIRGFPMRTKIDRYIALGNCGPAMEILRREPRSMKKNRRRKSLTLTSLAAIASLYPVDARDTPPKNAPTSLLKPR